LLLFAYAFGVKSRENANFSAKKRQKTSKTVEKTVCSPCKALDVHENEHEHEITAAKMFNTCMKV
jgi:hypothetical protein